MLELVNKRCSCQLEKFHKGSDYGFYSHKKYREKPIFGTIERVESINLENGICLVRIRMDNGEFLDVSSLWIDVLPYLLLEKLKI